MQNGVGYGKVAILPRSMAILQQEAQL